ncbi:vascular endothelial growth factor receptor 1 [Elysia marginata]|uniref:Vascular endothelial growth factor receptor 1 n=1 Tax=Elysia marginata TaxID=1093978 RepID=A0AAV4ELX4_9GAST|nr:vascular endothelial growth factor receptor 1 [Elysia marginata]
MRIILKYYYFFSTALGITSALEDTFTLTFSNNSFPGLQGSTAYFECGWSFDPNLEVARTLIFSSANRNEIYSYGIGSQFLDRPVQGPGYVADRMIAKANGTSIGNVVLTLSSLECSDEDTYTCSLEISTPTGEPLDPVSSTNTLTLKVPPSEPTVSILSSDVTQGVLEDEEVEFQCQANVGSTGKGRIHWRIYRGDAVEEIGLSDDRVTSSTVPVSSSTLTVTHDPQDVYHGGSVTLSCRAEGYPEPSLRWLKGNETMDGEKDGFGISKLVLSNLTVDGDSGIYMCVASNDVRGSLASVNKTINITVCDDTVIIVVVVIVVLVVVIAVIVGVVLYKRRSAKKDVEGQPGKPANNASNNLAFVQPDLVSDEKIRTPSLNNSFDVKNEDGLMYADLTYDNRPRSRKPLALGDNASDYSDIQMPHV